MTGFDSVLVEAVAEVRGPRQVGRLRELVLGSKCSVSFEEHDFVIPGVVRRASRIHNTVSLLIHWASIGGEPTSFGLAVEAPGGSLAICGIADLVALTGMSPHPNGSRGLHPLILGSSVVSLAGAKSVELDARTIPALGSKGLIADWRGVAQRLSMAGAPPALATSKRRVDLPNDHVSPVEGSTLFISVNPNAKDSVGHFVGFDTLLRAQLKGDVDFISLANVALSSLHGRPTPRWLVPAFSKATSPSHSRPQSETAARFASSQLDVLEGALKAGAERYAHVHLFWYLGCAEYLPMVISLRDKFPTVTWHIHLFWDFQLQIDEPVAIERFAKLVAEAKSSTVHLSLGSRTQIGLLAELGIDVDYFPAGPTVNLSDAQCYGALGYDNRTMRRSNTAIFPSNHAVGKNWELGARAALLLQDCEKPKFERVYVRVIDQQVGEEHSDLVARLRECEGIHVLEGSLSGEVLIECISASGVVILPYSSEWFRYRTSALLTEAIVHGARVVCLADTNLAEVVAQTESGVALSAPASPIDVASAILQERVALLSQDNWRARSDWYETTSWRRVGADSLLPLRSSKNHELGSGPPLGLGRRSDHGGELIDPIAH